MDEHDLIADGPPDPGRVARLAEAVRRAERGAGTAQDARALAQLAGWLARTVHDAGLLPEASGYPAALRRTFECPTEDEDETDALFRRLLGEG
jgi:hypothetical protein